MIKIGGYSLDMGEYTVFARLFLEESIKYIFLLLISVLAIRLWRMLFTLPGQYRQKGIILASAATVVALVFGYLSLCHSLSRLYSYYGMKAFSSGYLTSACSLFSTSSDYWKSADALGKKGVCLLLLGKTDEGTKLVGDAKLMRKGQYSSFESFYLGRYYLIQEQPGQAVPLLETASTDWNYRWGAIKALAVVDVDQNQLEDAARIWKPFLNAEVTDEEQAYVMASLMLFEGQPDGAKMLVDKFGSENLPPFWKSRFDRLRAKIKNQGP
jgi:hypothetical protein